MKIHKTAPGQKLFLGHRGENLALKIIFDIAPWVGTYGPGTAHLLHQRKGDAEPYPVATFQEGSEVSWEVSDADNAIEGHGRYELRYYVGETLAKSSVGETFVREALIYGAEPPEAVQGWLDHVAQEENKIYAAVTATETARDEAQKAVGDTEALKNAAAAAAGESAAAAQAAEMARKAAADSAGSAAASETNAKAAEQNAARSAEEAKEAAASGGGVKVTAKPGQLILVKEVDEQGTPTAWEAIDRTHWEEITQKAVDFHADISFTNLMASVSGIGTDAVIEGKTYTVTWNGETYECTAVLNGSVMLGNLSLMEMGEDTGEPFCMEMISANSATVYKSTATAETIAVGVSLPEIVTIHKLPGKFLPDGVPYSEGGGMVEILPETSLISPEEEPGTFAITTPISLTIGERYTVNLDGTEYQGTAVDGTTIDPEAAGMTFLANDGADMSTGEGTVFGIIVYPPEAFEETGYYAILMLMSGATTTTISIYQDGETIHKLDNKFLDLDWLPTKETKEVVFLEEQELNFSDGQVLLHQGTDADAYAPYALTVGDEYVVTWGGEKNTYVAKKTVSNDIEMTYIGNSGLFADSFPETEDTGELFCYIAAILNASLYMADIRLSDSVTGSQTVSITHIATVSSKMPAEYLPDNAIPDTTGVLRLLYMDPPAANVTVAISAKNFKLQDDGTYQGVTLCTAPEGTVEVRVVPRADSRPVANAANLRVLDWHDGNVYLVCDRPPTAEISLKLYFYGLM